MDIKKAQRVGLDLRTPYTDDCHFTGQHIKDGYDWLIAEHDRLTSALTAAKEEIERLKEKWERERESVHRFEQAGILLRQRAEAAESSLASERKETEMLRDHLAGLLLAVRRLKEAEDRYDAAFTGEEFTAAHQETLDAVAAIYKAALHPPQQEEQ